MNGYENLSKDLEDELDEVLEIIEDKLDSFGIYYRSFSRIKSAQSIKNKLNTDEYRQDVSRRLKDLLGVRIVLYYQDDIKVCKRIMESYFEPYRENNQKNETIWKQFENKDNTFDAMKINGVFLLPGFIKERVASQIEGLRIAPTFEIQLRTIFFEGWHEIEHDLRYKNQEHWNTFPKESRKLNSILATLEICDQYMVDLLNDMGHNFYKQSAWELMISYKYRIRFSKVEIDEQINKCITTDLAKCVFKYKKDELVQLVLEEGFNKLDANIIVYVVNNTLKGTELYVPEIEELFWKQYSNRKRINEKKSNIVKLKRIPVFHTSINMNTDNLNQKEKFQNAVDCIYAWQKEKLEKLYDIEFQAGTHVYHIKDYGVEASLTYDLNKLEAEAILFHISLNESGTMWEVKLSITTKENQLILHCDNTMIKLRDTGSQIISFSRPAVYMQIAEKVGLVDVLPLRGEIVKVEKNDFEQICELIRNPNRLYPVLVITYEDETDCKKKDSCYGKLVRYSSSAYGKREKLVNSLAYICHMYRMTGDEADQLANMLGESAAAYKNGIRIFGKKYPDAYEHFTEEEIMSYPKDIYAIDLSAEQKYLRLEGAEAMHREIIKLIYRMQ